MPDPDPTKIKALHRQPNSANRSVLDQGMSRLLLKLLMVSLVKT